MPEQASKTRQDFGIYILLTFTKELIRNTASYQRLVIKEQSKEFSAEKKEAEKTVETEIKEIKNVVKEQKKQVQTIVKEKIKRDSQHLLQLKKRTFEIPQSKESSPFRAFFAQRAPQKRAIPSMPQIPEPILPPTVQYLRPIPIPIEVNLKNLTPLVRDPLVRIIECNGPGENVVVVGTMGRKKTGTVLNKEEIDEIIKTFSEATKIPINEGVFKVVFGKLVLSAIISNVIGSKFIIKKMSGAPIYHR